MAGLGKTFSTVSEWRVGMKGEAEYATTELRLNSYKRGYKHQLRG